MRVTFRPTIPADIPFLTNRPLPSRIQAITAEIEGRIIGLGGFAFQPDGTVIAFAEISDEARKYPVAIHRAGLMAMDLIARSRRQFVVAEAQPGNPAAERWLLRLGFTPTEIMGRKAYVWERAEHVAQPV
ncbi:MAG TPA: hypothetical protein VNH21_03150 [Steroidobacteraceae bacterium]|nr:hypothetical protein [Steroidobacteraceae bacterium]